MVSIPKERGVTSRSKMSFTSPVKTAPQIAAPIATASSGLTDLFGYFPKKFCTNSDTFGIRVEPPTRITSSTLSFVKPESFKQFSSGFTVLLMKVSKRPSSLALVRVKFKCLGPDLSNER